jgi:DtxR family Mn-dependent transcriptional regulator
VKLTISKEDYVKAVAEAEAESDQAVSAAALRRRLNVSAPAVTAALRRLSRDGLVKVDSAGAIHLTGEGRKITVKLLRRHYLVERMLTEVFSMEWYKVHEEAERLEHVVSDDFERRLIARLGTDAPCPHGHQVESGTPVKRRRRGWRLLGDLGTGEGGRVRAVYERDRSLLEYLDRVGLRPGVLVELASRNVDETLTLRIGGESVKVGAPIGAKVWISGHADTGTVPAKAGSGPVTLRRPRRRSAPAARR